MDHQADIRDIRVLLIQGKSGCWYALRDTKDAEISFSHVTFAVVPPRSIITHIIWPALKYVLRHPLGKSRKGIR